MPRYGIFVLGGSQMSISGGKGLDGITQGTGVHLIGETITLNSNTWREVLIDDDETSFDDNDASQVLSGAQSVDGVSYASGTRVEAEYALTVSYAGQSYTLVGFNLNTTNPSYGTIEGLAFMGGPGGFPPIGVPLRVDRAGEGPSNWQSSSYARPICFGAGTRIAVPRGTVAVEDLRAGDRVCTLHHGVQRLVWCGASLHGATGRTAPIRFAPGVLGNDRALIVSPQHRIWRASWRAELLLGDPEVLIPACHFVGTPGVTRMAGGCVAYHHLMFAHHEIVFSDGVASESFHPGPMALEALDAASRAEIAVFMPGGEGATAARTLRRHEAVALLAA